MNIAKHFVNNNEFNYGDDDIEFSVTYHSGRDLYVCIVRDPTMAHELGLVGQIVGIIDKESEVNELYLKYRTDHNLIFEK